MLGMTRSTKKSRSKVIGRGEQISPSKVLAIVANWNNTTAAQEDALTPTRRNKRPRDEKLSSSSRRSKQKRLRETCLSLSDDDEVPSFKARSFYHSKGPPKYQSPLERREERDRLVDAGVDPHTLDKSFEDLKKERSSTNSVSEVTIESKRSSSVEKPNAANTKTVTDNKQGRVTASRAPQLRTVRNMQSGQRSSLKGEVKVVLSQSMTPVEKQKGADRAISGVSRLRSEPSRHTGQRLSNGEVKVLLSKEKKAKEVSPKEQFQRRTSPRKSASKASAAKGIQLYMQNLKNGQKKGKKSSTANQKSTHLPKENKNKLENSKETKPHAKKLEVDPVEEEKSMMGDKTARGLDFGVSKVNGDDWTPLEQSFDECSMDQTENNDLLNVLFEEEEPKKPSDTMDIVQNLLLAIDDDLEEGSAALKRSPRKRRMKTEEESMASPSRSPATTRRRVRSSTPLSSQKSRPKMEEWLWHEEPVANSPRDEKTEEGQRSKTKVDIPNVLTPESTGSESPKAPATKTLGQGVKLYPVFTPPTSPSGRNTPARKKTLTRNAASPRQPKRSPILKALKSKNDSLEQMTLDLGQKRFGAQTCATCGTVYTAAHPEDEAVHMRFHKKYLSSVKFPGWKQEDVLEEFHDGRIIVVTHDAPRYAEKKVDEIRELVDQELGFLQGNPLACKELCKTYLFITNDKKVGGCLIAEQITQGYRVIVDDSLPEGSVTESQKAWCCETESEPALCGISRIWVPATMRKQGIASRMVNCLRKNFTYGTILTPDDVAFSDPTPDGKIFATKYTGTPRFLVYKYH